MQLESLETNDATAAFAALQAAEEIELKAESMPGSGEDVESMKKKKKEQVLAQKKKEKDMKKKKEEEKKQAIQKKKKDKEAAA